MARILVVDDLVEMAELLCQCFEDMGHTVDVCFNGQEAIHMICENGYDLVVTDIVMPDRDGLELSKYIRQQLKGKKKQTPILAISGGAFSITGDLALSAARCYTNAVLSKPFTPQDLQKAVSNLLAA